MSYQWLTFKQARSQALDRLSSPLDSSGLWTDTEVGVYVVEALRTWNAAAQFYRDQDTFMTVGGNPFYDLTSVLTSSLLDQTVTDVNLYVSMQYHLMEPITPELAPTELTEMFAGHDFVRAVSHRRDQFLLETGTFLTHSMVATGTPSNGRFTLADSVIDIRHAAFQPTGGSFVPLWRTDEWQAGRFRPSWQTPGIPTAYSFYMPPRVGVTLIPVPSSAGILELVTVNTGPSLTNPPTGLPTGTVLGIPDDWAWVVKYGAMADMLSRDGEARDEPRAAFCRQMWETGLKLASVAGSVQQVAIGTVILPTATLYELDSYNPNWESAMAATPQFAAMGGLNMMAMSPVPATANTVTVDIVRNAPVPVNDTDFIQIGREQWPQILNYVEHLAMFKVGGSEFEATFPLAQGFFTLATENQQRQEAEAFNFDWLQVQSTKQERQVPRREVA